MPHYQQAVNTTQNKVVAQHVQVANNPITRFFGLMGKPSLSPGHGLWIVPCADIHSCFMRFEFDAIFLDKSGTVLHLQERMKPWRISKFVKGGRVVLEVPSGVIAETGTQLGDHLELQPL